MKDTNHYININYPILNAVFQLKEMPRLLGNSPGWGQAHSVTADTQ